MRAEAAEKNASLCPHCYALVSLPTRATPSPGPGRVGRVDGGGFRVELVDRYVFNLLRADTPEVTVFAGPEPGRRPDPSRGRRCCSSSRSSWPRSRSPCCRGCSACRRSSRCPACCSPRLVAYLAVRAAWGPRRATAPTGRSITPGRLLVPRMLQVEGRRADAAFLAGLAVASRGRGDPEAREDQTPPAPRPAAAGPGRHPLRDAAERPEDRRPAAPTPTTCRPSPNEIGESFDGALPLDHAETLVKELRGDPADRTRRVRLRVLMLARAFAAGLEAEDLRMIGQVCPGLGAAYASEDRDGLARLRLLWLYRPRRLWQRIGSATAVFDLARYPKLAENYLKQRPDLLLFQASGGTDGAAPILVCEEGVVYRDDGHHRAEPGDPGPGPVARPRRWVRADN